MVGARYSATIQTDPGAHPAPCAMGTGSFPWVKRPERGIDRPPPSISEVKQRVEFYLCAPSKPLWPCCRMNYTFTILWLLDSGGEECGLENRYQLFFDCPEDEVSNLLWNAGIYLLA